jgi:integrase
LLDGGRSPDLSGCGHRSGTTGSPFYSLALDTGARKGELCGLLWDHLDLDGGKMRIVQQLLKAGPAPVFGPPKTGRLRTVALSSAVVDLLRLHRQQQREMKLAHRTTYRDHGLVFAKQWSDLQTRPSAIGDPLQHNNLGQREYAQIIKAARVRRIQFHGLRHTCATLLLQARTPVQVVSERLGHATVAMTMEVYAHVLPDMQDRSSGDAGWAAARINPKTAAQAP